MKFKKSRYNIFVDEVDNKQLIFNSLSGAFATFNSDAYKLYNNIDNIEKDELDKTLLNYFNTMYTNGFIVESDVDEYDIIKAKENIARFSSQIFSLTIAPTMNCNMNCPYCYEKKENKIMSDDVIEALVKFFSDNVKDGRYKGVVVSWYGGEPLMAKEIVYRLSQRFIEICKNKNIQYSAEMITNGTLMDYSTAKKLKEECVVRKIQITIDGLEKINNERRRLKNNAGSFNTIISNLVAAKNIFDLINIRVNIDKDNTCEIDKLIEFFHEKDLLLKKNVILYFAPVVNDTEACKAIETSCYKLEEFEELERSIYDKMQKFNVMPPYPRTRVANCGAIGTSSFIIDPDGDLYRCWSEVNLKEKSIGNVAKGVFFNRRNIKWLSIDYDDKCKKCDKLPICQGGCPFHRIEKKTVDCRFVNSSSLKKALKIHYKNYTLNKII